MKDVYKLGKMVSTGVFNKSTKYEVTNCQSLK